MMGIKLIKISAVYFGIGIILGYYMSIVHSYALTPVHVHINLLGWTSLTLAGLIYYLFPAFSESKLAKLHVWLHNIGLPVMMIGLFFMIVLENQAFTPVVAAGATLTTIGVLIFVYHILKNLKSE
ncbi:cbb3-type cytochrome oxidase subunit 1 [Priestia megaterium]|jgi:cbb3-type cytochrome oxidase subunit 1